MLFFLKYCLVENILAENFFLNLDWTSCKLRTDHYKSLVVSMMMSFCAVLLSFFPRFDLDGIFDLIGSVSEGFPTYS